MIKQGSSERNSAQEYDLCNITEIRPATEFDDRRPLSAMQVVQLHPVASWRLGAHPTVDPLPDQVRVPAVTGVLLDHVDEHLAHRALGPVAARHARPQV